VRDDGKSSRDDEQFDRKLERKPRRPDNLGWRCNEKTGGSFCGAADRLVACNGRKDLSRPARTTIGRETKTRTTSSEEATSSEARQLRPLNNPKTITHTNTQTLPTHHLRNWIAVFRRAHPWPCNPCPRSQHGRPPSGCWSSASNTTTSSSPVRRARLARTRLCRVVLLLRLPEEGGAPMLASADAGKERAFLLFRPLSPRCAAAQPRRIGLAAATRMPEESATSLVVSVSSPSSTDPPSPAAEPWPRLRALPPLTSWSPPRRKTPACRNLHGGAYVDGMMRLLSWELRTSFYYSCCCRTSVALGFGWRRAPATSRVVQIWPDRPPDRTIVDSPVKYCGGVLRSALWTAQRQGISALAGSGADAGAHGDLGASSGRQVLILCSLRPCHQGQWGTQHAPSLGGSFHIDLHRYVRSRNCLVVNAVRSSSVRTVCLFGRSWTSTGLFLPPGHHSRLVHCARRTVRFHASCTHNDRDVHCCVSLAPFPKWATPPIWRLPHWLCGEH